MSKFLYVLIILVSVTFGDDKSGAITAQNMYPENNVSGLFQNKPSQEDMNKKTDTFEKVEIIDGKSKTSIIAPSTIKTTETTNFGKESITGDMDWTDPAKATKYFEDNLNSILTKGSNTAEDMRNKAPNKFKDKDGKDIDPLNPAEFTQEKILNNFEDENDAKKALLFKDELYKKMQASAIKKGQIQCYITRNLNNSYFCPIPSYGTATFGGGAKDSKEESKRACEEYCRIPIKCIPRKNNDALKASKGGSYILPLKNLKVPLNPEQITKEFSFQYIPENINAVQDKYFEDGLVRGRITIKGIDLGDNEVLIYDKYTYMIQKEGGKISLKINKNLKEINVFLYNSYIFDPKALDEVSLHGENPQIKVSNLSANFTGNSRYFCPLTQIVTDAKKCDGTLETLSFGGGSHSVCIPNKDTIDSTRSTIDGGFYNEDYCNSTCWDTRECVPTYKHLAGVGPDIPQNVYNIDYGCVDDENNIGCTKERCRELFTQDLEPVKEKVWEKDDTVVETVSSGVETNNAPRPKIDFTGELSTNNSDKENLFIEQMKDRSYQYMVENESFNVTQKKINEVFEEKVAIETQINSKSKQISQDLLYKARSDLYDSGKKVYLYPIIKISTTNRPNVTIRFGGNIYYSDVDTRILTQHSRYFLLDNYSKTNNSFTRFFPFMWSANERFYLPIKDKITGEVNFQWVNTDQEKISYNTFDTTSKKYVPFALNSLPMNEYTYTPNSDSAWTKFMLFRSLDYLVNTEGVLFVDKNQKDGMIYDQTKERTIYGSNYHSYQVFLVTSEKRLTYQEIINKLRASEKSTYFEEDVSKRGVLVYDSKMPQISRTEIEPDSLYADDRVSLYVLGKSDKRTMFMKLKPRTLETGHKSIIFMFLYK